MKRAICFGTSGKSLVVGATVALTLSIASAADPRVDSWFTGFSGKYARIYTSAAAQSAGNAVSTWSNGSQTQSLLPAPERPS